MNLNTNFAQKRDTIESPLLTPLVDQMAKATGKTAKECHEILSSCISCSTVKIPTAKGITNQKDICMINCNSQMSTIEPAGSIAIDPVAIASTARFVTLAKNGCHLTAKDIWESATVVDNLALNLEVTNDCFSMILLPVYNGVEVPCIAFFGALNNDGAAIMREKVDCLNKCVMASLSNRIPSIQQIAIGIIDTVSAFDMIESPFVANIYYAPCCCFDESYVESMYDFGYNLSLCIMTYLMHVVTAA